MLISLKFQSHIYAHDVSPNVNLRFVDPLELLAHALYEVNLRPPVVLWLAAATCQFSDLVTATVVINKAVFICICGAVSNHLTSATPLLLRIGYPQDRTFRGSSKITTLILITSLWRTFIC